MHKIFNFFCLLSLLAGINAQAQTTQPSQLVGLAPFTVTPLLTVGEEINGYQPVGIFDGVGAIDRGSVVRIFVNSELSALAGSAYRYSKTHPFTYGVLNPIPNMTAGTYLMGVKDKNNCLVTQSVVVGGALRPASERDAVLTDIQIQVGPNPTSSKLAVWIGAGLADTKGEWSVSDMSGRVWFSEPVVFAGDETKNILVENFPVGNYQLVLKTEDGLQLQKTFTIMR